MSLRDGIVYAALALLAALNVLLFVRLTALESRLDSRLAPDQAIDRRLGALKRTVESLSRRAPPENHAEKDEAKDSGKKPAPEAALALASSPPALDASLAVAAAEEEEGQEPAPAPPGAAAPLHAGLARRRQVLEEIAARFRALDRNSDAQVSLMEFEGDPTDFFSLDANGSGRISQGEIQEMIKTQEEALQQVEARDRNGDGALSPREFRGSPRRFRFLDSNGDGAVTAEEYVESHHRLSKRMEREDLDRDRKISQAEFGGTSLVFEKYDKNKDGSIDRNELKEMILHGHD